MGKKCDLSGLDRGMIVGAIQGVSGTTVSRVYAEWCKTSSEQQFCGQKCIVNERGQWRWARLVKADRKVTVMQITTHYKTSK